MNASYQWLREFTDFDLTPAQLRDVITSRAATVEELVALRADLADVVIGLVVEAAPHPDSDHLWVTRVDAGAGELLDVVCGAPNVAAGTKYPFAPAGSTLPGGLKLERRKIRGQTSNGMLCSARELALGADHEGILALDTDAAPGTRFLDAYPAGDTRLVIDVLPNRPDLLSHQGVAREIAAYTGNAVRRPMHDGMQVSDAPFTRDARAANSGGIAVSVDDGAACSSLTATVIRGVRVAPSPAWLVERLAAAGVRAINNVVDITNYMLHGFGQPMHAFDASQLRGALHVRFARKGETLTTLDGVARTLDASMTLVTDGDHAHAIAGVMGGKGSEVSDTTTDVVLEAAVFDPQSVRRTRRALNLSTDASYRFERGVDGSATEDLARYAAALIVALGGGRVDGTPVTIGAPPQAHLPLTVRVSRVAKLLGESVGAADCERLLQSVGFAVAGEGADVLRVTAPAWRNDVVIEADIIEEIARLRGYDTFSDELRPFRVGHATDSAAYTVGRRVTRALVECGLLEVRPIPFVADAGEHGVRVTNPLAENEAQLRSSALQTLARRVEHNFARMVRDVRLFEVGVVFSRGDGAVPVERTVAAAVVAGDRHPAHFADARPPHVDAWDARWIAERIARAAFQDDATTFAANESGDGWTVFRRGAAVGAVAPLVVDAPVWAPPVFGIELDITAAPAAIGVARPYRALPTTPAADFDLALVLPPSVSAADVERVVATAAGDLLEALVPFDEFRGAGLEAGQRSVAWRLTLRHPERTLREKEIEGRRARILRALDEELGVRPRTA